MITVITPTYKRHQYLKNAIDSVLAQTYTDYELIVTDDSDNDEIGRYMESLGLQERLRYVRNEKRLGHIHNWNHALSFAEGEYVKLMFSDDWLTFPTSLAEFVALLDNAPEASLAFSGSRQTPAVYGAATEKSGKADDTPEQENIRDAPDGKAYRGAWDRAASKAFVERLRRDYRLLFLGNEIGTPSAVIYRRTKREASFDPQSNWASDMFLYFSILEENAAFACTEKPLVCVGMHDEQYTYSFGERDKRKLADYLLMYRKYGLSACGECREYLKSAFLLPYLQPPSVAAACGLEKGVYTGELFAYIWERKVMDYVRAAKRKLPFFAREEKDAGEH